MENDKFQEFKGSFTKRPIPKDFMALFKVYNYFEMRKGEYLTYKAIATALNMKVSSVKTCVGHLVSNNMVSARFKSGRSPVFLSKCDSQNECEFIWGRDDIANTCEIERQNLLKIGSKYKIDENYKSNLKELRKINVSSYQFYPLYNTICDKLIEFGVEGIYRLELKSIAHRFRLEA